MKLQKRILPVLILSIFWGIIGLSMITGVWEAKAPAEDVVVEVPSDIKGWMNLEDVSGYFNISVDQVKEIFQLPAETDASTPLKDIAKEEEKETEEYKELLNDYLGIESSESTESGSSHEAESSSSKVTSSSQISKNETAAQTAAETAVKATADTSGVLSGTAQRSAGSIAADTGEEPKQNGSGSEETIKGRMTLKEVEYQTNVPASYICSELGIPQDVNQNLPLRDLAEEFNFEVDEIRIIVEEYK